MRWLLRHLRRILGDLAWVSGVAILWDLGVVVLIASFNSIGG